MIFFPKQLGQNVSSHSYLKRHNDHHWIHVVDNSNIYVLFSNEKINVIEYLEYFAENRLGRKFGKLMFKLLRVMMHAMAKKLKSNFHKS